MTLFKLITFLSFSYGKNLSQRLVCTLKWCGLSFVLKILSASICQPSTKIERTHRFQLRRKRLSLKTTVHLWAWKVTLPLQRDPLAGSSVEPIAQLSRLCQRLPTLQAYLFLSVPLACPAIYLGCPSSFQDSFVWTHITSFQKTWAFFHYRRQSINTCFFLSFSLVSVISGEIGYITRMVIIRLMNKHVFLKKSITNRNWHVRWQMGKKYMFPMHW